MYVCEKISLVNEVRVREIRTLIHTNILPSKKYLKLLLAVRGDRRKGMHYVLTDFFLGRLNRDDYSRNSFDDFSLPIEVGLR